MAYEAEQCVPTNVLGHADSVLNNAIALSHQVEAIVNHLCGAMPQPISKQAEPSQASAFAHLRERASDALSSIEDARAALRRLESEVGYPPASLKQDGDAHRLMNPRPY